LCHITRRNPVQLHTPNKKKKNKKMMTTMKLKALAARWCLAVLIFYTEDGGDTFLRNVCSHTDYPALYRRRCM
jgi:hypothetical protein